MNDTHSLLHAQQDALAQYKVLFYNKQKRYSLQIRQRLTCSDNGAYREETVLTFSTTD
jgi:hypothetical protein